MQQLPIPLVVAIFTYSVLQMMKKNITIVCITIPLYTKQPK